MNGTDHADRSSTAVCERPDERVEAWRKAVLRECMAIGAATGVVVRFSKSDDVSSPVFVERGNRRFIVHADHLMYAGDLARQFDYYFASTCSKKIDGVEVVDYSKPGWHTLPTGQRMFYTSFAEDAGATNDYISILRPMPGETVLDVGAYCGLSVIAFAKAVGPTGKVYAFEPDPANFAALKKNVEEAKLANVVLKNAALSSTEGTLLFSSEGNMGSAIVGEASLRGAAIEIRSERLKSLYDSGEIARIDVVKADIEGAEYALLEDSIDVIRKTKARWAIELHADPVTKVGVDVDRVRSIFDHFGYVSYLQPASESAAAPTLFTFPDERVAASRQQKPAVKTDVQLLSELQVTVAQQAAALNALQQAYRELELAQAQLLQPHTFSHRVRSLLSGR